MAQQTKLPTPSDARSDVVMMPALHRADPGAIVDKATLNEDQRTLDVVWTAGAEVPRMDWYSGVRYIEVLEVSEAAIRLDRLQSGRAPILDSHARWSLDNVMGVIEAGSVRIEKGQGLAKVRLSKREDIAPLIGDIRDGIIANVSPGYVTHSYREEMRNDVLYRIATDWEPMEISFVPVGADPDAGRREAPAGPTYPCRIIRSSAAAARMRMRQLQIAHG